MLMLKRGCAPNVPYETWLCNAAEEVDEIPESTPAGSIAMVLNEDDGLTLQMKNNEGTWVEI